jgi:hypothetical protein
LISLINKGYEVESYDFQRREMIFKVSKDKIEDFKKEVQGLNIREETAENYYRIILTF